MLTALLAVLALVFGVLTMAAPATAKDDPGKTPPGHSETFVPPGQDDVLPPGQDPDFVPPGQLDDDDDPTNDAKKVYICHADVNNGQGQPNLGQGGTGGQSGTGFNLLYISKAAATNAHFKLHPNDYPASQAEIDQGFCGTPPKCPVGTDKAGTVLATPYVTGEVPDRCDIPDGGTFTAQATYTETLCMFTVLTPGVQIAPTYTTPAYSTQDAANADAAAHWTTELKATTLAAFLADPANAAYTMPTMTDTGPVCITPEQAAAIDAALAEPATVAPVLPGTIEEPEAVAVPAPATVPPLPATIPAGDGSGTPTVPTALLALLALGATALAASTVHLVRTTR